MFICLSHALCHMSCVVRATTAAKPYQAVRPMACYRHTQAVDPSSIGSWPFKHRQLAFQTWTVGPSNFGCLPALQAACACCTPWKGDLYVLQETSAQTCISLIRQSQSACLSASCHNKLAVLTTRGTCMCMLTMSVVHSGKHVRADCV